VLQVARAEPQVMRERVIAAFESLFRAAGERGPVAIHLDDIHWADEESLHLLAELADRLEGTPLFVLLAARPELDTQHVDRLRAVDATRIELEPLGRRPLRRLLQGMLGPKIPAELLQLIGSWSDGNPYFAEELVTWLVSRRALVGDPAGGWQLKAAPSTLQLPAGIEATVQARLDLLDTGPKELLKAASVLGEVFWEDACLAMGLDDVRALLGQLEAEHFVVSRPVSRVAGTREWMFRHALLHQVAGQMLPRDRRKQLHLLAGKWLERVGETDAAVLAHHFERGGDTTRAASYHARAGEKSLADGDLERAVDCYLASISLPEDLPEADHVGRSMGLARAYILLGRYNQAGFAMDPLTPSDEAQRAEVLLLRGRIHLAKGQYEQAEVVLGEAIDALGPKRSFEARRALFATVWAQGRYGEAGGIAEEMYREACEGDQAIELCSAKLALAYYHAVGGDLSASVRLAREAVEHAREIGHPFREVDCLTLLASAQELVGLYDAAFASLEAAGALAQRLKTSYTLAAVEACRGRVCLLRGQLPEAREHYRNATSTAERLGDYRTLIAALAGEARALALPGAQQDLARARTAAAQALGLATHHSPPSEAEAMLALAEACLAADQLEEGVRHAEAALGVLDRLGTQERYEIEILLAAHAALSRGGQADRAAAVLERAVQTLAAREQRITDPELRRSFVEQVPHNRRVRELG
jgi:tetratricopeptide (TPR) repeat protein